MIPTNPLRLNCKDGCTQTQIHSVCVLAPPLRVKVLDSMVMRVNALSEKESRQATNRIWEYAQVEVLWKRS